METWLKVKKGDYRLWELKKRATGTTELPDIELVDNPKNRQHILSEVTKEKIQEAIAKRKQVLVFLNRRGYSPVLFCPSCGWMARCNHCSSFMVYHKKKNTLICHHCDTQMPIPRACPECGNVDILPRGLGTERLEEELDKTFPGVRLLRIDRDSVSRKKMRKKLLTEFIVKRWIFWWAHRWLPKDMTSKISISWSFWSRMHFFATQMCEQKNIFLQR